MDIADTVISLVKVIVVGLLLGAGLPAIFAVGLRAVSRTVETADPGAPGGVVTTRSRSGLVLGYACFAVVGLAVVAGIIWIIVN